MSNIRISIADVQRQVAELLAACPELLDDDDLRADTLEGETDLYELLARLTAVTLNAKAQEAAIKARVEALTQRRDAARNRQDRLRSLIQHLMGEAGLRKVTLPEATLSIGKVAPSVIITDEDQIPAGFVKVETRIDKAAIKAALKDGLEVAGACLSNGGESLTVRT